MPGINVAGVQFRKAGKIYDFTTGQLDLKVGDQVVVESDRGHSIATVARLRFHNPKVKLERKLAPIVRKATQKELKVTGHLTPEFVTDYAKEKISGLGLNMRVLSTEIQFGGQKILIFFVAPSRVDFRELVRDLATGLRSRVELKQVGSRDETKILGGVGICGREYCCSTFLREFIPVSIKMAKNQNLALNPHKVSGGCGRLLCCLTYENETYSDLRQTLPPIGVRVRLKGEETRGVVRKADLLNQLVVLEMEDGSEYSCKVSDLEPPKNRPAGPKSPPPGGSSNRGRSARKGADGGQSGGGRDPDSKVDAPSDSDSSQPPVAEKAEESAAPTQQASSSADGQENSERSDRRPRRNRRSRSRGRGRGKPKEPTSEG